MGRREHELLTPEREKEIRDLATRFTAPGSKHARIGAILTELFAELDAARSTGRRFVSKPLGRSGRP